MEVLATLGQVIWVACLLVVWTVIGKVLVVSQFARNGAAASAVAKTRRVLLVIAHPDDEAMFFAPTLMCLAETVESLHVLCLSTGNAAGLGDLRERELEASCTVLKIPKKHITVIDHSDMQDGMTADWKDDVIIRLVDAYVDKQRIDTVITFDSYGVSGHKNHRAVHRGVRAWAESIKQYSRYAFQDSQRSEDSNSSGATPKYGPVQVWQLVSTSIWRKFLGVMDITPSSVWMVWRRDARICFVAPDPGRGRAAMRMHLSQWVWYRRLFVWFSRYAYVNTLEHLQ